MIPVIGLLAGIALGLLLEPSVPLVLQPYLPIAIVAAMDALIGALRLARPASLWARRFYRRRHRARARAVLRAYHHDVRWVGPRRRFQDLIGGAPDKTPLPGPRPGGGGT